MPIATTQTTQPQNIPNKNPTSQVPGPKPQARQQNHNSCEPDRHTQQFQKHNLKAVFQEQHLSIQTQIKCPKGEEMWIKENDEKQLRKKADVKTSRLMNVLNTFGRWPTKPAIPVIDTRNEISSLGESRPNKSARRHEGRRTTSKPIMTNVCLEKS